VEAVENDKVYPVYCSFENISFKVRAQSRMELVHSLLGIYLRQRNQKPLINNGF
jgi:hypothetical protein